MSVNWRRTRLPELVSQLYARPGHEAVSLVVRAYAEALPPHLGGSFAHLRG
jgi:hypothetical protein